MMLWRENVGVVVRKSRTSTTPMSSGDAAIHASRSGNEANSPPYGPANSERPRLKPIRNLSRDSVCGPGEVTPSGAGHLRSEMKVSDEKAIPTGEAGA